LTHLVLTLLAAAPAMADRAEAQSLGTFRWQLQPFCNVVVVTVTQQGAVYKVDGYDDQCGAAQRAPLVGLATPNPDGSIGFGLHVVTAPGGRGLQIAARITLDTLGGGWTDSAGNSGTFAFGGGTGGTPRPEPAAVPTAISLLAGGGLVARGIVDYQPLPESGAGTRLLWHPGTSVFRAGTVDGAQWNASNVGLYSTALGFNTTASGSVSTALGNSSTASGLYSVAIGVSAVASGDRSTALGFNTTASALSSTAFGSGTTASGAFSTASGNGTTAVGQESVALGRQTTAAGAHAFSMGDQSSAAGGNSVAFGAFSRASAFESVAMGLRVTAAGNGGVALGSDATATAGSFVFGDRSTNGVVAGILPNQFTVRAAGGAYFYSSSVTTYAVSTPGVQLLPGTFAWSSVSDANAKENFRELSDDDVLARIAGMPVRQWNYKTQGAGILHMGPTAQDFHRAFGLGEDPLRISTIDADGVALAGVHALESRTRELRVESAALREQVAVLTRENDDLRARLARLEALLDKR
jgi:hypothetical protein